jgi:glycosyltransferase involved in cell wall biosynthesis
LGYFHAIIVCRPENMLVIHEHFSRRPECYRSVKIIYDSEAIGSLREIERMIRLRKRLSRVKADAMVAAELAPAVLADLIFAVTNKDAVMFENLRSSLVRVLGHSLAPQPTAKSFFERKDFLFVGRVNDDRDPNADSIVWFIKKIMPQLDQRIGPNYTLHICGIAGARRLEAEASDRVKLHGRVDDLSTYYDQCRLFIAPTRFAAGIPHKVHEAVSKGVPCVVTSLLAKQLEWETEEGILSADTPEEFATACAKLYEDDALWMRVRRKGLEAVTRDCDPDNFREQLIDALSAVGVHAPQPR